LKQQLLLLGYVTLNSGMEFGMYSVMKWRNYSCVRCWRFV